jgi:hypothetical protein
MSSTAIAHPPSHTRFSGRPHSERFAKENSSKVSSVFGRNNRSENNPLLTYYIFFLVSVEFSHKSLAILLVITEHDAVAVNEANSSNADGSMG